MDVTIPANSTALVYVPTNDASRVKESGVAATKANGVNFLEQEGRASVFEIGSGRYSFTLNKK
jgi:alpha-L-rhamnosidase